MAEASRKTRPWPGDWRLRLAAEQIAEHGLRCQCERAVLMQYGARRTRGSEERMADRT